MNGKFEPKPGWNSINDDIVNDFYRKALDNSISYDRLAGFFNSNTFAIAMREVLDFVERRGKMRLITSAEFSQADLNVINNTMEGLLMEKVECMLEKDVSRKCLSIFGHMLSTMINEVPQLEIKIIIPKQGIFHPKVGIFTMRDGDIISFSGSVNETGIGWAGNVEEFKVFCSWKDQEFVDIDRTTFKKFWHDEHPDIRTYSLPNAVREKILTVKPDSDEEYKKLLNGLKKTMYGHDSEFELRGYQKNAIESWVKNGYRGIFEMPTATGKTFTAMGCINRLQIIHGRLFTVIAVPYTHLIQQWEDNIKEWNSLVSLEQRISSHVINTTKSDWKSKLQQIVADFNKRNFSGDYVIDDFIVCTTYAMLSKSNFIEIIRDVKDRMLLVADEAHHTGAAGTQKGLLEEYYARLALTATPIRYFDDEGSELISKYFSGVVYSMKIGSAIKDGYLSTYDYHPVFVKLTDAETVEYVRLTRDIAIKANNDDSRDKDDLILENKRARIVAKAEQKYQKLEEILMSCGNMENALVYCHDNIQLEKTGKILTNHNISYDVVDKSKSMIERRAAIKSLTAKNHHCIVAMKCLDEGVDIPSARLGIIMASTGNSLQYIQRRGRFLRKSHDKEHAVIYDILVEPPKSTNQYLFARKLVAKELIRHKEFAEDASNKMDALNAIRSVAHTFKIDLDKLDLDYIFQLGNESAVID